AWAMASQHPWFGVGWFGFGAEQVRIAADFSASTYAEHAHNLILNFAAELGWPATFFISFALAWWTWQTCLKPSANNNRAIGLASLCFIAVGVHSMVEFPLWYAYVLLPIALMMGMVHQLRWPSFGVAVPRIGILLSSMFGCVLLTLVTLDYQRVVSGFKILHARQSGKTVEDEFLAQPSLTLFSEYYAYFSLSKIMPRAGMSVQEIAFVESTSQRFGYVHVLNKLAEVYALNNQPKKAQKMMLTLQRLHPFAYPEYFDFWKRQSEVDARYRAVFVTMPKRDVN
ncbi:MAG: Wzy polymerase domain-containing protein, partial [Pseudomonadota bacterium]